MIPCALIGTHLTTYTGEHFVTAVMDLKAGKTDSSVTLFNDIQKHLTDEQTTREVRSLCLSIPAAQLNQVIFADFRIYGHVLNN